MTLRGVDTAVNPEPAAHPERRVERLAAGGFEIRSPQGGPTRAVPGEGGLRIDGPAPVGGCRLVRGRGPGARFILLAADGRTEIGRSAALHATEGAEGERNLVMEDGRTYRLLLRGPAETKFELLGWETPGAYLTARPGPKGWTLTPQPAASGLRELGPLLVLLAAEILESEEGGRASGPETET